MLLQGLNMKRYLRQLMIAFTYVKSYNTGLSILWRNCCDMFRESKSLNKWEKYAETTANFKSTGSCESWKCKRHLHRTFDKSSKMIELMIYLWQWHMHENGGNIALWYYRCVWCLDITLSHFLFQCILCLGWHARRRSP